MMYHGLIVHFLIITFVFFDERLCSWHSQLDLIMSSYVCVAKPFTKTNEDHHHKTIIGVTSLLHQAIDTLYSFVKLLHYIKGET